MENLIDKTGKAKKKTNLLFNVYRVFYINFIQKSPSYLVEVHIMKLTFFV